MAPGAVHTVHTVHAIWDATSTSFFMTFMLHGLLRFTMIDYDWYSIAKHITSNQDICFYRHFCVAWCEPTCRLPARKQRQQLNEELVKESKYYHPLPLHCHSWSGQCQMEKGRKSTGYMYIYIYTNNMYIYVYVYIYICCIHTVM